MIKRKSRDVIDSLREQATTAEREHKVKQLKNMRAVNWSQKLFGANVDFLVSKYIAIVKRRVIEKEDETLKGVTEAMVTSIIKKFNFNKSYKAANVAQETISDAQ